jgi:flagellar motor switch protein FliM
VEPILSKDEITDLLSAIKSGAINVDSIEDRGPGHGIPKIAQELDLFGLYSHEDPSGEVRIPNLDIILDTFARNFGNTLTNTLQRTFQVERTDITTSTFQGGLMELNNQGAIGIFNTEPLKHGCLFHFDSLLAFTLLEIMLGSSDANELMALERNLTTIEINVLTSIMAKVCGDFSKAMTPVVEITPELIKVENNFRLVNIVDANAEIMIGKFQLKSGTEKAGELRLIIPSLTLEPLRESFKEIVTVTQSSNTWGSLFAQEALETSCLVTARSGSITMNIKELMHLQEGDIIDLGYDPDRPLDILVENRPKFSAVPGERNGKKAFHITGQFSNRLGANYGQHSTT